MKTEEEYVKEFMENEKNIEKYPDEKERKKAAMENYKCGKPKKKPESSIMENARIEEAEKQSVYNLKEVEIFRVGTWNGQKYTEKDLDDMVKAHEEVGHLLKPFMKLGHNEDQSLLKKDGMPAAGWLSNIKRKGDSLVADIINVPKKIYTMIKMKNYGRFSSEIYWNLKMQGKTFRRAIHAVALLGADTPAVETLDDFINLYTELNYDKNEICNQYKKEESKMDELKELQNEITELKRQNEEAKKYSKELEDKILEEKKQSKRSEIKAYIDQKMTEGIITPSQVDYYFALCLDEEKESGLKCYTNEDKKTVEGTSFDFVKSILDNASPVVDFDEKLKDVKTDQKTYSRKEKEFDDEKMDKQIKEYAKQNNVSYDEAFSALAFEGVE